MSDSDYGIIAVWSLHDGHCASDIDNAGMPPSGVSVMSLC